MNINNNDENSAQNNEGVFIKKSVAINANVAAQLDSLSKQINELYGFVKVEGSNYGEPAINSGPCGPFAHEFYKAWNARFLAPVNIAFVMQKNPDECYHILTVLPDGKLFDGGIGIHSKDIYITKNFEILPMKRYDLEQLEKYAYGLEREYPKYCPNFNLNDIRKLIEDTLHNIYMEINTL